MRTKASLLVSRRSASMLAASVALGLGACNWMEFDDLADTAWVTTTGAPTGVNSNDFALAVVEAVNESATPADTKQVAVISRGDLTMAFFAYTAAGEMTSRQTFGLSTSSSGPFEQLSPSPVYASDPKSGRVAVASDGKVAVGDPSKSTLDAVMLGNSASSAGVTFLEAGSKSYIAAATERGVFLVDLSVSPAALITCAPVAAITRTIALGTVRIGAADQLVIWYQAMTTPSRAELQTFSVGIAGAACTLTATGTAYTDLSLPNGADYPLIPGARIATLPEGDSIAVADPLKGVVSLHKLSAPTAVMQVQVADVAAISVGKIGADTYLVAGAPNQDLSGTANAGRVQAIKLSGITPAATPDLTLHDTSPDTEQRFGRAVALIPFADATSPIVVVGASDELFTYFRTTLYGERRAR